MDEGRGLNHIHDYHDLSNGIVMFFILLLKKLSEKFGGFFCFHVICNRKTKPKQTW
jgi:hypothetical protein